jgi:hypothetical protein
MTDYEREPEPEQDQEALTPVSAEPGTEADTEVDTEVGTDTEPDTEDDPTFVAGVTQDNAVLLLAAAEEAGLDPSVVVVDTTRGGFTAPEEVVSKAKSGDTADNDEE